ncbi:MAG TPA: L-histidine N(alpha)-methyltransferase [Thermoanaerobaculia bacterium]|jgi:L-histidine N-alpha-methyltransferase|nr:L-histidine N(alpha)-methyltransferase [Thermoanaerobaculia bacterium]
MLPREARPSAVLSVCYSAAVLYAQPSLETQAAGSSGERFSLRRAPGERARRTFAEDVRAGLAARPKFLLPKYFYDELGSRLFEAITALPEYYLTRAETEILREHAGEIAGFLNGPVRPVRLLELGSGDSQKTRLLIEALLARQGSLEYLPIDISEAAVEASARVLLAAYPDLRVTAHVGEYQQALRALRGETGQAPGRTLVLFLGSTLGNLDPEDRPALLRDVRGLLAPGEAFLLGVDLKKSEDVLIPAYDDPLGVTAAFNLNLLGRINRELGGDFDLAAFKHRALYNREAGRMEMHLESRRAQTVAVRALGIEVSFEAGETVHTESSYKFDRAQVAALAAETGFELARTWTDSGGRFASSLLAAR